MFSTLVFDVSLNFTVKISGLSGHETIGFVINEDDIFGEYENWKGAALIRVFCKGSSMAQRVIINNPFVRNN